MGTNFYLTTWCPHCGDVKRKHLGKSSCGWKFLFHKYKDIKNYEDFKEIIQTGDICDEYGELWSAEDLIDLIESKQNEEADVYGENINGYIFIDNDFR